MKFNKKIQKLVLATSVLFASLPSYSLSGGGIAGVTIGAVAGAAVIGTLIGKSEKRKDRKNCSTCKKQERESENLISSTNTHKSKKDLKHDLHHYRHDLRRAKSDLRSSQRNDKKQQVSRSAETMKHESIVAELKQVVEDLKNKIEKMV